ncbi:putative alpha glucanase protein [Botrytis fragariae]|uniref:Putative alpha glucanase protein n=1 Tax=Botrytis fragariae TaxID=1964551 RepID=A0A8H6EFU5_9HELO|nr:putative alpha glucanase protein [Botrytis fragariae]KAF5870616.1 putative alpha glucanase protein [Botrytis fragariae]
MKLVLGSPSVALPVAGSALKPAIPDICYSLETTLCLSGSVTEMFPEAQFINLRTFTAPTITTKSLVERSTGLSATSSTTTLIPICVQAREFCWSPVPIPTPLPIKIPSLPEFPPIPNPPYFKFLDIFSIDFPPDKSKSTSTFRSGKLVEPTCTSNCGSLCTANCRTTGTPTSTECATETATNYWSLVSNTVTGCAVEPSVMTFTATNYCPLVALQTCDDEERSITPFWTMIQTTISERVSISGFLYIVTSGSITVNGVEYSVSAVVNSSAMVLGGLTATLYPLAVVSSASITAPGYGTNPLTPTSTVAPVQSTTTSLLLTPTLSDPNDEGARSSVFLCNQGNTLLPGGPAYTYVYTDPTGINVIAQVNWASDQTGGSPEDGWSLGSEFDICEAHFDYNVFFYDDESIDHNYGGAYIWHGPLGCIEYMIYAIKSGSGSSSCSYSEDDGCTPESPACCADGTCDSTRKSVMNRVTLISESLGLARDQNTTQT